MALVVRGACSVLPAASAAAVLSRGVEQAPARGLALAAAMRVMWRPPEGGVSQAGKSSGSALPVRVETVSGAGLGAKTRIVGIVRNIFEKYRSQQAALKTAAARLVTISMASEVLHKDDGVPQPDQDTYHLAYHGGDKDAWLSQIRIGEAVEVKGSDLHYTTFDVASDYASGYGVSGVVLELVFKNPNGGQEEGIGAHQCLREGHFVWVRRVMIPNPAYLQATRAFKEMQQSVFTIAREVIAAAMLNRAVTV